MQGCCFMVMSYNKPLICEQVQKVIKNKLRYRNGVHDKNSKTLPFVFNFVTGVILQRLEICKFHFFLKFIRTAFS